MGKYIPAQTNLGVTRDSLIEISDKTIPGLLLLEIVHNVKKKLGCIFVENHNSDPLMLKRGQTLDEQGQTLEVRKEDMQRVTGQINDTDTCIGGTSVGDAEKAGQKAYSVQCTENRQFYETKKEKCQFVCESFSQI